MSLQDLVNRALDERRDADYRRARADALLSAVIGEAERLRAAGVSARELDSDQRIGTIRLDGANLPASPVIEKTDELASWLAETAPGLATASISVPVGKLEEVLELLEMAGLRDVAEAKVAPRDLAQTLAWLGEHCKVQADPDIPHAWNVMHQDDEGHLTAVPGVTARPPTPTWKVIIARDLKTEAVAVAKAEVGELVRELRAWSTSGAPSQDPSRDADGFTVGERPRWHRDGVRAGGALKGSAEADALTARADTSPTLEACAASPKGRSAILDSQCPLCAAELGAIAETATGWQCQCGAYGVPEDLRSGRVTPNMPKPLLTARARELGLPTTGTKAELVERINSPREHALAVAAVDSSDDD